MTTGEKCVESGVYEGECVAQSHKTELSFQKGELFTPCEQCHAAVTWQLKQRDQSHLH